jgi:hypothetical protein
MRGQVFISAPQSDEVGLPPSIVKMFEDPTIQQVAVITSRKIEGDDHIAENFSIYNRFEEDPAFIEPQDTGEKDLLTEDKVRAWLTSAGFDPPLKMYALVNSYDHSREDPWWLIKTSRGMIQIGFRYRVINIDWSETPVRKFITEDNVTKSTTNVHAWSVVKAIEYLTELRKSL